MKITKNESKKGSAIEEFVEEIMINLRNWLYKSIKSIDKNEYINNVEYIISYYINTAHKKRQNEMKKVMPDTCIEYCPDLNKHTQYLNVAIRG